jgi:predicted RNA-binding protein YlqC (UPF0109 family)
MYKFKMGKIITRNGRFIEVLDFGMCQGQVHLNKQSKNKQINLKQHDSPL